MSMLELLAPALGMLTSTIAVLALALLSYKVGALALGRLGFDSAAERVAVCCVVGLGVVGYFTLALGLLALIRWPVALGALGLGVWVGTPELRALGSWLGRQVASLSTPARVGLGLTLLTLSPVYLAALHPPTEWDATMYHLVYSKEYLATHHVAPVWRLRWPVFPQLTHMLFTLVYALGGETAPALVQVMMAGLTATALYAWGRRVWSARVGALAAALWFANPLVVWMARVAYVEVALAAFATVAVLAAARWSEDRREWRWLAVAASTAGFCLGTKHSGLIVVAFLAAHVVLVSARARAARPALIFATVALVASAPFPLYSLWHTGNPVFPFLGSAFGPGPWGAEPPRGLDFVIPRVPTPYDRFPLPALPWLLTAAPERFGGGDERPFLPILPAALALTTVAAWRCRALRLPLAFVLAFGIAWASTLRNVRYLVPAAAILSLCAVAAMAELVRDRWPRFARSPFAALALGLLLLVHGVAGLTRTVVAARAPLTVTGREHHLDDRLPGYRALAHLNRTHGRRYSVYALRFERLFFFAEGDMRGDVYGPHNFASVLAHAERPDTLHAHLSSLGFDYLLTPNDERAPPALRHPDLAKWFTLVDLGPAHRTFRLVIGFRRRAEPVDGPMGAPSPTGSSAPKPPSSSSIGRNASPPDLQPGLYSIPHAR